MIALALALALMGQTLPDETGPLQPTNNDWVFRASLTPRPAVPACPADSPAKGAPLRDVLVMRFHANAAGTLTEIQCGREVKRVDLTPREAALELGLFKTPNYEPDDQDRACTEGGPNSYEVIVNGETARLDFRCAPPETLANLVGDLRKMMVAQYAN
jgi:hypothetical protein